MNQGFFNFVGYFIIESVGRKMVSACGYVSQGISFAVVAIGLGVATTTSRLVAVAFMFVFVSVYGMSNCYVPWVYPAEINSQKYRFLGAAAATGTNWIFNYVVVVITPIATDNIGYRYYIIYAVLNVAFAIIWIFFFVETSGKSLEEIDQMFAREFHSGKSYITPNEALFTSKKTSEVVHVEDITDHKGTAELIV